MANGPLDLARFSSHLELAYLFYTSSFLFFNEVEKCVRACTCMCTLMCVCAHCSSCVTSIAIRPG